MYFAEAQRRIQQTEADLHRGALPKAQGCVVAGFDRRAEGFKKGDVQSEVRRRFPESYMDSGMVKLLRRAGVLVEDRSLKKELVAILTMCVSAFVDEAMIDMGYKRRKTIIVSDVVATKVLTASSLQYQRTLFLPIRTPHHTCSLPSPHSTSHISLLTLFHHTHPTHLPPLPPHTHLLLHHPSPGTCTSPVAGPCLALALLT